MLGVVGILSVKGSIENSTKPKVRSSNQINSELTRSLFVAVQILPRYIQSTHLHNNAHNIPMHSLTLKYP